MSLSNTYGLIGICMDIIGAYILVFGFFGKGYSDLYNESASSWGYNQNAFTSLAEQKGSGIAGFCVLLFGFVEQAIAYLPYKTPLTIKFVVIMLIIINITCISLVFYVRHYLIKYYVGLLLISWVYNSNIDEIPNQYVVNYLKRNSLQINKELITILEKRSRRNIRLFINIAKIKNRISDPLPY